ncbi:unnamed protein product [Phytophthora fragariaefolia]|uniref:Unnamed protein product n=1 Tax=Phytophthora fragariaefolia TaxID=1490495 RepID=A0A9W6UE90_9STRA|nr:unnamed protein product [Phytophthora fragariaefolia]
MKASLALTVLSGLVLAKAPTNAEVVGTHKFRTGDRSNTDRKLKLFDDNVKKIPIPNTPGAEAVRRQCQEDPQASAKQVGQHCGVKGWKSLAASLCLNEFVLCHPDIT